MGAFGKILVWLVIACSILCGRTTAEYLKDEDVHLQIYSPPGGNNLIALELVIYNRDEEFYVMIRNELDQIICQGQFSRFSAERVKCSYKAATLREGDNFFHVTITAVANNEVVLDTTTHFFYESNRVVPADVSDSLSETYTIIAILVVLLLLRYGGHIYRGITGLFIHSSTTSDPPPPPPPSLPITAADFEAPAPAPPVEPPPSSTTVTHVVHNHYTHWGQRRLFGAVLLLAAALLGGRVVLGPRRQEVVHTSPRMIHHGARSSHTQQVDHYPQSIISQTVGIADGSEQYATDGEDLAWRHGRHGRHGDLPSSPVLPSTHDQQDSGWTSSTARRGRWAPRSPLRKLGGR